MKLIGRRFRANDEQQRGSGFPVSPTIMKTGPDPDLSQQMKLYCCFSSFLVVLYCIGYSISTTMNLMLAYFTVALSFVGGIKKVTATYSIVKSTTYPNDPYTGTCVDDNLQGYPAHQIELKDWSPLDNHFTLCKDYCNQHLLPGYVGLSYFELNNKLFCWCLFDSAVGLPDVTYNPPSTKNSPATGTGPVKYAEGNGVFNHE
eukprot:scaffold8198_cov81-Cyclotella_meneghiniana.AAC.4